MAESNIVDSYDLYIDGNWVEAVSGKTFETFDPATEQSLGSVAHGERAPRRRRDRAAGHGHGGFHVRVHQPNRPEM